MQSLSSFEVLLVQKRMKRRVLCGPHPQKNFITLYSPPTYQNSKNLQTLKATKMERPDSSMEQEMIDNRVHFSESNDPWTSSRHASVLHSLASVEKVSGYCILQ